MMITDAYENLSEFMETDEITSAWETTKDDINYVVSTLMEAVKHRLHKLGYNEYTVDPDEEDAEEYEEDAEEYEDGSNEEIEKLLEIRDELDSLNI